MNRAEEISGGIVSLKRSGTVVHSGGLGKGAEQASTCSWSA